MKKIKLITIIFIFLLSLTATIAIAKIGTTSHEAWEDAVYNGDTVDKRAFDKMSTDDLVTSLTISIIGCVTDLCPKDKEPGALKMVNETMVALIENPPVSGITYFAGIINNLGVVKPAYAQEGVGFKAFEPILPLWRAVRDLTYFLFIIVFAVVGLSIMFRVRLNPQTAITVQSALPRIIMALVMVTFSYAIAGLLIDLSYVIFFLVVYGLQSNSAITLTQAQAFSDSYTDGSFFQTLTFIQTKGLGAVKDILGGVLNGIATGVLGL